MSAPCIALESRDGVTVLRIDRPPANAISLETTRELEVAFGTDAVAQASSGSAQFGLTEVRLGIPFPAVSLIILRAELAARDLAGMPVGCYQRVKQQLRRTALAEIDAALIAGAEPMLDGWLAEGAQEAAAATLGAAARRGEKDTDS